MIEYFPAPEIKEKLNEIIELLRFDHVQSSSLYCIRSRGSKARRTIARIHGLGRIWQMAMGLNPTYIIEVIAERYDYLSPEDQDRTLVHELMHIPHGFKGGFRHHKNYVTDENVEVWYRRYMQKRRELGLL